MLLQITNTCTYGCRHCMQNSTPEPQHMSLSLFVNVLKFMEFLGARMVCVTGGEPTDHPDWDHIVSTLCTKLDKEPFSVVMLATNGKWLGNEAIEEKIKTYFSLYHNFYVQVTSVKGLYPNHEQTVEAYNNFISDPCFKDRIRLDTELSIIRSLGRAAEDPEYSEKAANSTMFATSCFGPTLSAVQLHLIDAHRVLESKAKFCHPLVDWQGGLHWSESWLCPPFGNIPDNGDFDKYAFDELAKASRKWRPCGNCADYQKLLNNHTSAYEEGKRILGIPISDKEIK